MTWGSVSAHDKTSSSAGWGTEWGSSAYSMCSNSPFPSSSFFHLSGPIFIFVLSSFSSSLFCTVFPVPLSPSIPLWVGGRLNGHVWVQRGQMKEWLTHTEGGWGGRAAAGCFREWGIPCKVPEVEWRLDHGGKKEEMCLRQQSSAGSATLPKRPSSIPLALEVHWSVGDPYWCVYATAMSLENFSGPMHSTVCVDGYIISRP